MGKNSGIEWTTHTFNPWWGCVKVSPGCERCYAETLSNRYNPGIWGPAKTTSRRLFGEKHWGEPLKWHKEAVRVGERHRVFVASMADVFEDHPQVVDARAKLFEVIDQTPMLDWLLLTKRPENVQRLSPVEWWSEPDGPWSNIWLGTSVEDQKRADERVGALLGTPAIVHFLSVEPLLGPVDLTNVRKGNHNQERLNALTGKVWHSLSQYETQIDRVKGLDWVIVGGESGPGARPMHPQWAMTLRDQCVMANVAFHFKQWGEYAPFGGVSSGSVSNSMTFANGQDMLKVGKKAAGRLLDGQEWNEFPKGWERVA